MITFAVVVIASLTAWLAWRWYDTAVLVVVLVLPVFLLRFSLGGIPTNLLEVLVAVLVLVGMTQPAVWRAWSRAWRVLPRAVLICVTLFVVAVVVAALLSDVPRVSWGIVKGWVVVPVILGWLVYALAVVDRQWQQRLLRGLMMAGVVTALVALADVGTIDRLRGWYDVPNSLALWLAPLTVLTAWWAVEKRHARVWLVPLGVALVLTQSMMGAVAVVVALGIGAVRWFSGRRRRRVGAALLVAAVVATSGLWWSGKLSYIVRPLYVSEQQPATSVMVRWQLWRASLVLIREQPLLGVGLGQFEPAYQRVLRRWSVSGRPIIPEFVVRDPHNVVLSFWLNTGLLGLVSFAGLHVVLLRRSLRQRTIADHRAFTLALVCLLLFGLTDTIYWKNDLAALHWVLVGILSANNVRVDRVENEVGGEC